MSTDIYFDVPCALIYWIGYTCMNCKNTILHTLYRLDFEKCLKTDTN